MRADTSSRRAPDEVVAWRRRQLAASGFRVGLAAGLATDGRYDLHELMEVVERGCAPELAVRIFAPLDTDGGAA